MKRADSTWFAGGLIVVVLALGAWAWSVLQQSHRLDAARATLDIRRQTLENELREQTARRDMQLSSSQEAEASFAKLAGERSDFERVTVGLLRLVEEFSALPKAGGGNETQNKRLPPLFSLQDELCFPEMLRDPEYLKLCMTYYRYGAETQHAPLLNSLTLPEDRREEFLTLLAEKRLLEIETAALMKAKSYWNAGVTGQSKIDAIVGAELYPEIRSAIGEAAFEQYRDFERTQWVRSPVASLAKRLEIVRMPLSGEQEKALVDMLYSQAKPDSRTGRFWVTDFSSQAVEEAKSILTAGQWKELQATVEQRDAQQKFFTRSIQSATKQTEIRKAAEKK